MSWHVCTICDGCIDKGTPETPKLTVQKKVNYHEASENRQFRITIVRQCAEATENGLEALEAADPAGDGRKSESVHFYVDLTELTTICPYFQQFQKHCYVEFSTNCTSTWISSTSTSSSAPCPAHTFSSQISPRSFHSFLESACPALYSIRPVPLSLDSVPPVLEILSHFHSEPLLTNCERFLMAVPFGSLDPALLIRILHRGLCVSLDHRILARILCVCLMNTHKMADVSQELHGTVGAVFAQAFVANAAKGFRHPKRNGRGKNQRKGCDHANESFECILCFDQRCGKCKGETAFCYKALDNFLYEVRVQLYPHTYRPHLDRDLLREDRINDYILRHQLQPLP
ncbi:unnamed protein product [Caenorhabditis sp. 36 PRJEB53466]|nr:unnamed protein product [Caenorhabditis sp. 36 PRJEB53466]